MTRAVTSRAATLAALVLAFVAVAFVLTRGAKPTYTVHAHFVDAGQLVPNAIVQTAGRKIGTISALELTDDGLADIVLEIDDERYQPLRRGTVASIRQVGLAGVANRFVDISPGPRSGAEIPDGGVLTPSETRPIVDLDHVLNALDPRTRDNLQSVIRDGAKIFAGAPAPRDANRAFRYVSPAFTQLRALGEDALADQAALEQLLPTSATVATVLAGRRSDVEEGIVNTAVTLRALAGERRALQSVLVRAPNVMRRSVATLQRVQETLPEVRPALRDAQPVAKPLARTLRTLRPTVAEATPVVADVAELLGPLRVALKDFHDVEAQAVPALDSLTTSLEDALPIVKGLRPYTADLINGILVGFGGAAGGYYDANGQATRIALNLAPDGLLAVLLGVLFPGFDPSDFGEYRIGLTARCPGAAAEPAQDDSNPWRPDTARCDPDQNHGG